MSSKKNKLWDFWVDIGGTFTDVIACDPQGNVYSTKILSVNPQKYKDSAVQGIKEILKINTNDNIPEYLINNIRVGTTVATNALLEKKGEDVLFITTKGFKDIQSIGYQVRPKLFDLNINLPTPLYKEVLEVDERVSSTGEVLVALDKNHIKTTLKKYFKKGYRTLAVCLMHAFNYNEHEKIIGILAREIGFSHISLSHEVSPVQRIISRGYTTVLDAYLSPVLRAYVNQIDSALGTKNKGYKNLLFMKSDGGLCEANFFQGKDAILSGPAGGVVGMVKTAQNYGFDKIIGFDMGGTSTDVCHYAGEYERIYNYKIFDTELSIPMMNVHTIAAGGGSLLKYKNDRMQVGPESAGSIPGPACYGKGGELTITDCNLLLGKIQTHKFPKIFGPDANQPLDLSITRKKFNVLAKQIPSFKNKKNRLEQIAEGFLKIAVENMANSIKKITIQRGHNVENYVINCYGGAGGQHVCQVADVLGVKKIFIHQHAGVLSALGIGLANLNATKQHQFSKPINKHKEALKVLNKINTEAINELLEQGINKNQINIINKAHIRTVGSDKSLIITFDDNVENMIQKFNEKHKKRFGFIPKYDNLIIDMLTTEAIAFNDEIAFNNSSAPTTAHTDNIKIKNYEIKNYEYVKMFTMGFWHEVKLVSRNDMVIGETIIGPAIIVEKTGTNIIEPSWQAKIISTSAILLTKVGCANDDLSFSKEEDPIMLEIFNNLFMTIAEEMGDTLSKTASSVNMKERLDFSCALFDAKGNLVANAPHVPVHLGSMSDSIKNMLEINKNKMRPGDVLMTNNPFNGGTHLPDITVITPVFNDEGNKIIYILASRGHHADIGGITPGSCPPDSQKIYEEGVVIDNFLLVDKGQFREKELRILLSSGEYPCRNVNQNVADLLAQIAANETGIRGMEKAQKKYSYEVINKYMQYIQNNAEKSVGEAIANLNDYSFKHDLKYELDNGDSIVLNIKVDTKTKNATLDFSGTSKQDKFNYNAPLSICKAATMYVFRTLIKSDIPLNEGFLKPIKIIAPRGTIINPNYPAAVIAGNTEISQAITNALFRALGIVACSQGTMNNFAYGNENFQNYETICGGTGAGNGFNGTTVHSHMTNTKMLDPEILEIRYPVRVEEISIRKGSGGKGKWNGGDGLIRKIHFLEKMTVTILSSSRKIAPYGLCGGEAGAVGINFIEKKDGSIINLKGNAKNILMPGDSFIIHTPGGGGYGQNDEI